MSLCNLTPDVYGKLTELIKLDLQTAANSDKPFVVKDMIEDIYNLIFSKKQDYEQALGYAQHVPSMITTALVGQTELTSQLQARGLSLDELAKLNDSFSKELVNVFDYIMPSFNPENFLQESVYDDVPEEPILEFNPEIANQEFVSNGIHLDAEPMNFHTTTGRELINGKIDKDKEYSYKVLRGILTSMNERGLQTAAHAEYKGHVGFTLSVMLPAILGKENLLTNDEGMIEPVMVITDNDGKVIKFDTDGNIDESGRPSYFYLRAKESPDFIPQVRALKAASLAHVKDEEVREGMIDQYMKEFILNRNTQKDFTKDIHNALTTGLKDAINLDITGGKKGFFSPSISSLSDLASKLNEKELDSIIIIKSERGAGKPFITLDGVDEPVELVSRPIDVNSDLANNIVGVLLSKNENISTEDKVLYLKQFIYGTEYVSAKKSTNIFIAKGTNDELVLQVNGVNININNYQQGDKPGKNREGLKGILFGANRTYINVDNEALMDRNYKKYSFENGVLKTTYPSYIQFIVDNFNIKATPNLEGRVTALNGYLNWQPTVEELETTFKPEPPIQKDEDESFKEDHFNPYDDFSLDITKRLEQEEISKGEEQSVRDWWSKHPLTKHVSLKHMLNIVNSNAWATWNKSGIILYQGSNETHIYHEAWHAFSQLYLTKGEKESLYAETAKLPGTFTIATKPVDIDGVKSFETKQVKFSEATKRELEEYLAEEFRSFARAQGKSKTVKGKIKTIFDNIWEFIKAFYNGITNKDYIIQSDSVGPIEEIFNRLYVGDINNYKPSIENAIFNSANIGVINLEGNTLDGLNSEQSKLLVSSIDGIISNVIDVQGTGAFTQIFKNKAKLIGTYNTVLNNLVLRKTELTDELVNITDPQVKDTKQYYINILDKAIQNYGNVVDAINKEETSGLVAYHIQNSIYKDRIKETKDDFTEDAAATERFGDKRNDVNLEDELSTMSLYLVNSLTEPGKLNELGFPMLANHKNVMNFMAKNFTSVRTVKDLYNKIYKASITYPVYNQLLSKLGNPGVNDLGIKDPGTDMDLWMKFLQDFNKYRADLMQVRLQEKYLEEHKSTWELSVGRAGSDSNNVLRTWSQQFRTNPKNKYISVSGNINSLNYPTIIADFIDASNENVKVPYVLKNNINRIDFLNSVGIYMTDNELVRAELKNHKDTLNYIAIAIGNAAARKEKTIEPLKLFDKESTRIKTLAQIEAEASDQYSGLSRVVPGGKRVHELMLNSSATQKINALNDARSHGDLMTNSDSLHMDYLNPVNNPWGNKSVTLDSLYDSETGKRKVDTEGKPVTINIKGLMGTSIIDQLNQALGMSMGSMVQQDKFITDFTFILNGVLPSPQHGNKTSVFATLVSKITTYKGKKDNNLYVDRYKFVANGKGEYDGFNKSFDIIIRYLQAEIERIHKYNADRSYYDKIDRFQEAGEFSLFRDILSDDLQSALLSDGFKQSLIDNKTIGTSFTASANRELASKVKGEVKVYFDALINRYKETNYNNYKSGIPNDIYKSIANSYQENTLMKAPSNEISEAALRAYTYNSWIHMVEMDIIHYGETYTFTKKGAIDKDKRISTFFSTGNIFPTDKISMNFINNEVGTPYRDKLVAEGLVAPKYIYDGTMNTAVIDEANPESVYKSMMKEIYTAEAIRKGLSGKALEEYLWGKGGTEKKPKGGILKGYWSMDEGDGQGWVAWDTYRILKRLEGKWSDAHEELFQKITRDETVAAKDISDFFPVYKLQYAGPLKTEKGKLPINAIHKFSLYPMIPNVIANRSMDKLHHKMIEQNIGYALFRSGSKLGTITNNDNRTSDKAFFDNDTEKFNDNVVFTPNPIYLAYLKDQLDLGNKFKESVKAGTQLRKLLSYGLIEDGVPIDFKGGKVAWDKLSEKAQREASPYYKLVSNFRNRIDKLVAIEKAKLEKDTDDMESFLKKELAKQGFTQHEIDFIDFDAEGNIIQGLDSHFGSERIERILMSVVNSRLINLKLKGEALVEVSVAFTQNNKFTKPTEAEQAQYYGTSGLPFYYYKKGDPLRAMKVKVAMRGDFENIFQVKDLEGNKIAIYDTVVDPDTQRTKKVLNFQKSLDKVNELIRNDAWLDKDNNRKLVTLTGVRIPTQSQNSMEFAEVYEFLPPSAGTIIILPTEIVAKSGTDFDVDKLSVYLPYITKQGNWIGDTYNTVEDIQAEIDKITTTIKTNAAKLLGSEPVDVKKIIGRLRETKVGQTEEKKQLLTRAIAERDFLYTQIQTNLNTLLADLYTKGVENLSPGLRVAINDDAPATYIFNMINDQNGSNIGLLSKEGKVLYKQTKTFSNDFRNIKKVIDSYNTELETFGIDIDKEITKISALVNQRKELEDIKRNYRYTVQNSFIQDVKAILELPVLTSKFLAPNDVHYLKPISEQLEDRVQDHNYKISALGKQNPSFSTTTYNEADFQIKRHQDNIVAGESLGFVAIGGNYNNLHNEAGAYLNPTTPVETGEFGPDNKPKIDPKTGKKVTTQVDTVLYLNHNKDKNKILISKLKDVNNANDIGEILSQAVSGFVDAEKDPWVAFIQGNKETIPQLIMLLEAGVDVKEAIYFVSQPAIRDYIKAQKNQMGIFTRFTKPGNNPKFAKRTARIEMIDKYFPFVFSKDLGILPAQLALYKKMTKLKEELYGNENISLEDLDKMIYTGADIAKINSYNAHEDIEGTPEQKEELKKQQLMLLHYLFLEDLNQGYSSLKHATNVDTTKSASFFDAFLKAESLEELRKSGLVPKEVLDFFTNNSVISSFFQQDYALEKFGKLFPIKNNKLINDYLKDLVKDFKTLNQAKISLDGVAAKQNFVKRYKNDFMLYIFTNYIKDFQLGKSEFYKGIRLKEETVGVKHTEGFRDSVYVKDENGSSVIHINMKAIQREYRDNLYLASSSHHPLSYSNQHLAAVPNLTFKSAKEYQMFVVEREYLRFLHPITKLIKTGSFALKYEELKKNAVVSRKADEADEDYDARSKRVLYEIILRDKALENNLNHTYLFESGATTYARQMMNMIKKYDFLKAKYKVLEQFVAKGVSNKSGGTVAGNQIFTLSLRDIYNLDEDSIAQYHDDLTKLADESVMKIAGNSYKAKLENTILSKFFQKLPLIAFIQGGMNMGENNITQIVPTDSYKYLIKEAQDNMGTLTKEKLNKFTDLYLKRQGLTGPSKTKVFNYDTEAQDESTLEVLNSPFIRNIAQPGVYLLDTEYKKTTADGVRASHLGDVSDTITWTTNLDKLMSSLSSNNHLVMSNQALLQYYQRLQYNLASFTTNVNSQLKAEIESLNPKQRDFTTVKTDLTELSKKSIEGATKARTEAVKRSHQYITDKRIIVLDRENLAKIPANMTDAELETYKKQFDANLQDVMDLLVQDQNLAFTSDGFAQGFNINNNRETNQNKANFFVYLSEQLLTKFSYSNPGSLKKPSVIEILKKIAPITQEEVDTNKNKCFGL